MSFRQRWNGETRGVKCGMTRGGCATTRGFDDSPVGPCRAAARNGENTPPPRYFVCVVGFFERIRQPSFVGSKRRLRIRVVRVLARTSRVDAVVEVDLHALLDALEVRAGENTGLDGGLGRRRIGGGRHRRDVGRHLRRYALSGRTQKRSSASNASQKRSVFSIGFLVSWVVSWACVRAADQGGWRGGLVRTRGSKGCRSDARSRSGRSRGTYVCVSGNVFSGATRSEIGGNQSERRLEEVGVAGEGFTVALNIVAGDSFTHVFVLRCCSQRGSRSKCRRGSAVVGRARSMQMRRSRVRRRKRLFGWRSARCAGSTRKRGTGSVLGKGAKRRWVRERKSRRDGGENARSLVSRCGKCPAGSSAARANAFFEQRCTASDSEARRIILFSQFFNTVCAYKKPKLAWRTWQSGESDASPLLVFHRRT